MGGPLLLGAATSADSKAAGVELGAHRTDTVSHSRSFLKTNSTGVLTARNFLKGRNYMNPIF